MHPVDFAKVLQETVDSISALQAVKGGEYAADGDRLANFKEASRRLGGSPEKVLLTYLDKHYAALCNFVRDLEAGRSRPRSEPIQGRADDMIVYLILFKALLVERHEVVSAVTAEVGRLSWEDESGD